MDPERILERKQAHLKEWLERNRKAQAKAPIVQRNLEITQWELKAVRACPQQLKDKFQVFEQDFQEDLELTERALPLPPHCNEEYISVSTVVSSSASSIVYGVVFDVRNTGIPEAIDYSDEVSAMYRQLQTVQDRPREVRRLLEKLNHFDIVANFDTAEKAYLLLKSGTAERPTVAIQIRNVLESMKGYLWQFARKTTNENMTWEIMSERLSIGGLQSKEYSLMIKENKNYSELIEALSIVAKNREGINLKNIEDIWTRFLDHVYRVLSLVNIRDGENVSKL